MNGYEEPGFGWEKIRRTDSEERLQAAVDERQAQVDGLLADTMAALQKFGISDVSTLWITPTLIGTVKVSTAKSLLQNEGLDIEENITVKKEPTLLGYTGYEARPGMRLSSFLASGLNGSKGNRVNIDNPVILSIYDEKPEGLANHPGFYGRRSWHACTSAGCTALLIPDTGGVGHGDECASVAAGSVEAGQDPGVVGSIAQAQHSGVASGVKVLHLSDDSSCGSLGMAIQNAITSGVDIMSHSYNMLSTCDPTYDVCGYKAILKNSADSGITHTFSMGNGGHASASCSAIFPGFLRDGISMGAVDTPSNTTPYDPSIAASYSGRGGMQITLSSGLTLPYTKYQLIDLVAPGEWDHIYTGSPGSYGYGIHDRGVSFSTPAVAAGAALFRHAMRSIGQPISDARMINICMLLMGDGYASDLFGFSGNTFDPVSGAGRVHMHYPSSANLVDTWGWLGHSFTISPGQTVAFRTTTGTAPMPSGVTQWKVAMSFVESDYTHSADLDLAVYNTCPAGGGSPVLLAQDTSYDIRSRVTLNGGLVGKCLEYHITAPTLSGTRTVYAADYFHSGNISDN